MGDSHPGGEGGGVWIRVNQEGKTTAWRLEKLL